MKLTICSNDASLKEHRKKIRTIRRRFFSRFTECLCTLHIKRRNWLCVWKLYTIFASYILICILHVHCLVYSRRHSHTECNRLQKKNFLFCLNFFFFSAQAFVYFWKGCEVRLFFHYILLYACSLFFARWMLFC